MTSLNKNISPPNDTMKPIGRNSTSTPFKIIKDERLKMASEWNRMRVEFH